MLDRVLSFAIVHRYLVLLGTLVLAAAGLYSVQALPIDAVPDITPNQVQINTEIPGLTPVEIEKQVTYPIEIALTGIPGLTSTRSLSRIGFSQVTAVFRDKVDIYFARQQVSERIIEAKKGMPTGAEPKMGPITTGLGEIYVWTVDYRHENGRGAVVKDGVPGWQSDGSYLTPEGQRLKTEIERTAYLRTVQDWIVRPQLKGLEGVAEIDAIGGYVKKYHVQPDPLRLFSYGLSFDDLIDAIKKNNQNTGAGYIEHKGESYVVRAEGRISNESQIADIVVSTRDGVPIHLHEVASVSIGKELRYGSASANGKEVVVGTALMLIGSNSRTVAAAVEAKIHEIAKSMPPDVQIEPILSRTKLVDATIDTIRHNLTEGAILVIGVLFLLLGSFRAALITALAIPLSMLMAGTGMVHWGISGTLMSLGAIDFGLIVDGAIIIVENCIRRLGLKRRETGRPLTLSERLNEVSLSTREVIRPSLFGQAIIIVVYFPVLALSGVEGKMFHPMAMTVIFALVSAFILSITFVPAMVAILIRDSDKEAKSPLIRIAERYYAPALTLAVQYRMSVVFFGVAFFLVSLFVFSRLGQEFVPTLDEKDIAIQAIRIPSTSLTQSTEMQLRIEKTIKGFPEVASVVSKTGTAETASDPMPPCLADMFVVLKPQHQWPDPKKPKTDLVSQIEHELAKLPGNNFEFSQPIQMRVNCIVAGVPSDVAVKVYGDNFDTMRETAESIAGILRRVPGAADVTVEQTTGLPVVDVDIDRTAAARYGLHVSDIQDVVGIAVGGREAGLVFEGDRRFEILVRLPEDLRQDTSAMSLLPVPISNDFSKSVHLTSSNPGKESKEQENRSFIPLKEVANIKVAEGLNQISRENGKRRIVVQANVRGRDLGSFVAEAQSLVSDRIKLSSGLWLDWGGQFGNLLAARKRLGIVVPICFLMIFLFLFSAFNSVKYALLVFSGVPLALTGGIISLWLRGMPFSISAAVGFVALAGVAVLNGLVMVSHINQLRNDGMTINEAVTRGSLNRLRPVLMTALVAALGFVPMAFSTGTGAEVQRPLATVVIGGLISSTALTLMVLPALYSLFERNSAMPDAQAQ